MAMGKKGTKGEMVKFVGLPGIDMEAAKLLTPLSHAAGHSLAPTDVHRKAHLIGIEALRRCAACVSGVPCAVHDEQALMKSMGIEPPKPQKPATTEGFQATVDLYDQLFREARGRKPSYSNADFAAVKRMLDKHGQEATREAIEGAFADHSFWRGRVTIRQIAKDPDQFRGLAAGGASKASGSLQREGVQP
jgi:hypothetical protein